MQSRPSTILFHVLGWLLLFSLIAAFVYNEPESGGITSQVLSPNFLLFCSLFVVLFYLNTHLLIPELYLKKKFLLYLVITAVLLTAIFFVRPFDQLHLRDGGMRPDHGPPPDREMFEPGPERGGPRRGGKAPVDIVSIVLFAMTWSTGIALTLMREWRKTQEKATRAEADKTQAELSFLRAQINPHFLFNTLNNIYSLAVTKNDHTPAAIMKLSNIMRYVTDDAMETEVSLQSEVDCITDYIDLQRLRLSQSASVEYTLSGEFERKNISPLLLMTFIENVFKYGVSAHEPSPIIIKISADDNTVTLYCRNKIFSTRQNLERTGIGISNTKQRLEHLYPGRHELKIEESEGFYTVELRIRASGE
ncbi:MAG: sensor histidine kinase [Chitinophagaceae bacterium]